MPPRIPKGDADAMGQVLRLGTAFLLLAHGAAASAWPSCLGPLASRPWPSGMEDQATRPFMLFPSPPGAALTWPETAASETFHLVPAGAAFPECRAVQAQAEPPDGPARKPDPRLTALVAVGSVAAMGAIGYVLWWHNGNRRAFHFGNERWFGSGTYVGGADKASHFVGSYIAENILREAFTAIGHESASARRYAAVVTFVDGLLMEVGDGFKAGGFSWQDLAADSLGILAAVDIERRGWQDMIGIRWGTTGTPIPAGGSYYSNEMYLIDGKLKGILQRARVRPGLARYLMVSASYSTKGYAFPPPAEHQRLIGIELGPNLPEVLRSIGVRDNSWWGKPLLLFFTYYRPPFTTIGIRYDLNSHRWYGPNADNKLP